MPQVVPQRSPKKKRTTKGCKPRRARPTGNAPKAPAVEIYPPLYFLNRATLWKRLFERGLLLAHDTDNKTGAIREDTKRVVAGRRARVLVMSADLITGCDDDWQAEHEHKNRFKSDY